MQHKCTHGRVKIIGKQCKFDSHNQQHLAFAQLFHFSIIYTFSRLCLLLRTKEDLCEGKKILLAVIMYHHNPFYLYGIYPRPC